MRPTSKFKARLCLLVFVSILFTTIGWGNNTKIIERINFSSQTESVKDYTSFCVTEDGFFVIPDYEAGDIKIYKQNEQNEGRLDIVTIIGSKGYGEGQFVHPTFCFYGNQELAVWDFGLNKIFIYSRIGMKEFSRTHEYYFQGKGTDFKLSGTKLLIAGYSLDKNGNPNDLFYVDWITKDENDNFPKTFLLDSYKKFGLNSRQEYGEFIQKPESSIIGKAGLFDVQGDDAFFVWEAGQRILKINTKLKKVSPFGEITSSKYVKPFLTPELERGYRNNDNKTRQSEKEKMTYIRSLWASKNYVLVICEGPKDKKSGSKFWMQVYSLSGDVLKEIVLPKDFSQMVWFDKGKNTLYSLVNISPNGDVGPDGHKFYILKYRIF